MHSTAANSSAPSVGGGVLHLIGRVATRMAAEAERRRTLRQLRSLDAATLRDIGMSRAEIAAVAYGGAAGRRARHE